MVSFFKRRRKSQAQNLDSAAPTPTAEASTVIPQESSEVATKERLFRRLYNRLSRTRDNLTGGVSNLILGKKTIDEELLEEIETQLLIADVGVEATQSIVENLTARVSRRQIKDPETLMEALRENMRELLLPYSQPLVLPEGIKPFTILMVGVNGVGKTTTIGKLAKKFQAQGCSVMLAAGDTFRAAAVEQLQVWGERNHVPVIAQRQGADSASVVFDAMQSAQARGMDILIADTAGRLHTQANLMAELEKVKRVMSKVDPKAPHEVLLTIDAGTGQNALNQAQQFHQAIGLTGITLTKLDGTAKGGIIFAIAKKMGLPIRFIGVGEGIDDLRPFDAEEFVDALLTPTLSEEIKGNPSSEMT